MNRLLWMGVGGALAVTAARRTRKKLDPVLTAAAPVSSWVTSVRALRQEFREAMARREAELQAAFIDETASPERPAPAARRRGTSNTWVRRIDEDALADDDDEMIYSF